MASTRTKTWAQPTPPSSGFLIKCAKEKEKLRSKFRKQLQEHMLYMLSEGVFSNILLGVNRGKRSFGEARILDLKQDTSASHTLRAHKSVLKVRTPAFLEHIQKYEESNIFSDISYQTHLDEPELREFLKNIYTDDDIRKHECEAIRISKTYLDILCEKKSLLNKHVVDTDDFEKEESIHSACTDNFVTPKTSPLTPDRFLDLPDILQMKQNSYNLVKTKMINNSQISFENSNKEHRYCVPPQGDVSEGYISELDNTHDEESILDLDKVSHSALALNSTEISSTSVDIDESVLDEFCSPNTGADVSEDSDNSNSLPSTSGMVRSNTFDLHTQAPLEDFVEKFENTGEPNPQLTTSHKLESFNGLEDSIEIESSLNTKSENSGFFLHDKTPSPKPNLFNYIDMHAAPNTVHFRRNDGSMSDSGFMSYSTISTFSETGMSTSLIMSDSNISPCPPKSSEETSTNLEKSKRLSGSMFPFYIDINNLPPDKLDQNEGKKAPPSVYMFIDAAKPRDIKKDYDPAALGPETTNFENKLFTRFRSMNNISHEPSLTKALSTPHLQSCKDQSSPLPQNAKSPRPQSCYMYIDLNSIEEKNKDSQSVKRAPSSISMFVDLNDNSFNPSPSPGAWKSECVVGDPSFMNLNESRSSKEESISLIKDCPVLDSSAISDSKRKLSDTCLPDPDNDSPKIRFHSLRKPSENLSDSALNSLVNKDKFNLQSNDNTILYTAKSLHNSSDFSNLEATHVKCGNFAELSASFELRYPIANHSASISDSDQFSLNEKFSEVKYLNSLCDDLAFPYDNLKSKQRAESEVKKSNDIDKETGLLPMSPILRRKTPVKEKPKPSPPVIIKASTRPQDVEAMKFPVPEIDDSKNVAVQNNVQVENLSTSVDSEKSHKRHDNAEDSNSKSSNDSSKLEGDVGCSIDSCNNKVLERPASKSDNSIITVSAGETSSSDKLVISDSSKDRPRSPLSNCFPCDFEDDIETVYSEVSDLSSSLGGMSGVASLERRWREGYSLARDASSHGVHNMYRMLEACSKLGEDMLRMFLEEIDTDIAIEVEGCTIKAHRCILVSRCKYFASLLKGDNFSNGEAINLEGFSYLSVHFALCHIYSGAINLPKDINIIELALLADVLSLDTLVDVIILHLKTHYCHFFHKPCLQCIQGVIECLPLAVTCGFNHLQEKCINWLGRYFTKTWTNKLFAALPEDLRTSCFQSTVKSMSVETVIEMTLSCDRIITTLPHLKWTEPIFGMVSNLLQECIHFMANNFNKILCSEGFLILGKGQSWNVSALDDDIMSSVELMTPDVACKSCVKINQILSLAESGVCPEYGEFTQNFVELLHKINRGCERYLIHNANKVVHCQSWACLPSEVQKKVRDAAVIVFEFEKPTAKPPRLSSLQRKLKKQTKDDDDSFGCFESSTYPKPFRCAKNYSSDISERTFCIQRKTDKDKKNVDHRKELENGKKIVSPIKEESQANGPDSRKSLDFHEEDSLKEMQDLPHDHSLASQNVFLDASQHSSSAGNIESEDNHSGTHCSDNPDSLDANEDISMDSKDDLDSSMFVEDDSEKERVCRVNTAAVTEIINHLHSKPEDFPSIPLKRVTANSSLFYTTKPVSDSRDHKISSREENNNPRNYDTSPTKRSPVKSFVPLSKTHLMQDKESLSHGKDLVAEIDADSRMVTHCLQEAEMLEQQLSRKLHQQKTVSSSNKSQYDRNSNSHIIPCADGRRSSRISVNRVQKSLSTSQMKNLIPASVRGKSPAKLSPSPSSPLVPRVARPTEGIRENKSTKKQLQLPKSNFIPTQKSFRSADGVSISNVQKQVTASKRISTRSTRSRSSVIATVRDGRATNVGPK